MNISYQITFPQTYFVVYYIIITILQFSKLMAIHYCGFGASPESLWLTMMQGPIESHVVLINQ